MDELQHDYIPETRRNFLTRPRRKLIHSITKLYPTYAKVIHFKVDISVNINGIPAKTGLGSNHTSDPLPESKERGDRRARTELFDIVASNQFTHFVTLTFDPKKVKNRYDVGLLKTITHRWFEKQRKIHGRFGYIVVAERHKDGAIHFHALFEGFKGVLKDSGVKHDNKPVYNLTGWTYGFSTAKVIDQNPESSTKVAGYMAKYIAKDMAVAFSGGKRYWSSQGLVRPQRLYNDYEENPQNKIYCATLTIYPDHG